MIGPMRIGIGLGGTKIERRPPKWGDASGVRGAAWRGFETG